ncbi:MAG: PH domain-containing protein [Alphaproteobacteria bacterium]|nr:PH domain-containing protein [Alphaproteobacteria bacterium]
MSSYVKRAMQPNERIIYSAQLHWIIYRTGIFTTFLGALLGHVGEDLVGLVIGEDFAHHLETPIKYIAIAIIFFGALDLVFSFIRQLSTELVVTDQRVIAKHGFIATTSYELMMTKVEGATIDQSVMGRLLGYGTLMVKGTGGGISPIDHVADPYKFHSYLMSALRESNEGLHVAHAHD